MTGELIPSHGIPHDWAEYLCQQVCSENKRARLSWTRIYCWFSHLFTGEPAERCYCRKTGNTGCPLVNARERHYYWAFHKS